MADVDLRESESGSLGLEPGEIEDDEDDVANTLETVVSVQEICFKICVIQCCLLNHIISTKRECLSSV